MGTFLFAHGEGGASRIRHLYQMEEGDLLPLTMCEKKRPHCTLFPLNGCWWFRGDVIYHSINMVYFIYNT